MQPFKTEFALSKEYLAECYDQTLPHGKNARPNYLFPAAALLGGIALLRLTEQYTAAGWTLIGLAILELVHIRFRRTWWLARQRWGKTSDTVVTLTLDEDGIQTQSRDARSELKWQEVQDLIETEQGLILIEQSGAQQYLSKALFSEELIADIKFRCVAEDDLSQTS